MKQILVIDDDPQNREVVRIRLEQAGHRVIEAENGMDGLRLAGEQKPSLIILDVMMPRMDGWQVCRQLRQDRETRGIPVIMLTARTQQIEELRGWESGADEYLTKPCDHVRLLQAVEKTLRREGAPQ